MNYSKTGLVVAVAAFGIALIACSDDVAKVTEVSEVAEITEGTGQIVIAKGEKLPDCTKDREGEEVFVTDSASVYHCAEGKWSTLKGPAKENDEKTVALYRAMGSTETDNISENDDPPEKSYSSRLGVFYDDRDSRAYKMATIEVPSENYNRTWMAENLSYHIDDKTTKVDGMCGGPEEGNCFKYGRLYNWRWAREICPAGWHLPSVAEWKELFSAIASTGKFGSVGDLMKAFKSGTEWSSNGGGNGTDTLHLSVFPVGRRSNDGSKENLKTQLFGEKAFFWTSTPEKHLYYFYKENCGNFVQIHDGSEDLFDEACGASDAYSIRCIKDY